VAELLLGLSERHPVALVHLRDRHAPPVDARLQRSCQLVEEVWLSRSTRGHAGRALYHLRVRSAPLRGTPRWVEHCAVPEFARRIREVALRWHPDVVQLEYHVMGQYLPAFQGLAVRRVLTQYEPGAAAAWERWRSSPLNLALLAEARAWQRFERWTLGGVHAAVVLTRRDREHTAALAPPTRLYEVPLGGTVPERPLDPLGATPPVVLFVGSYAHPPNVAAADHLARIVMPRVWRSHPDARLAIVGAAPPRRLRRLAGPRVQVTGRVEDVTPFLDEAAVVVAPLRLGGGMRVKLLDALGAGKAIVATSRAVVGLSVVSGKHLLVADGDDEIADAVITLLADPGRRLQLAAAARAWAVGNLGSARRIVAYEAIYEDLLGVNVA
jgi:glycosyltransferase involved in cell wall biosynthesis